MTNREKFARLLKGHGYDCDVDLINPPTVEESFDITSGNYHAVFIRFGTVFPNKESYIFAQYSDDLHNGEPQEIIDLHISQMISDLRLDKPGVLIECGWQFRSPQHVSEYPNQIRKNLLFTWMKSKRELLKQPSMFGQEIHEGLTLAAWPYGDKNYLNFTSESRSIGTRQRQQMVKRFGFSDPKSDGTMYGVFDKDLKLCPLQ